MNIHKSAGVWPVMLTPFTPGGELDYYALDALIDWYIQSGVEGLFAVCQSSEMFFLTLRERLKVSEYVKRRSTIPVIASGHIADSLCEQTEELRAMADTGVDAVIMITNRQAQEDATSERWLEGMEQLLSTLPVDLPLGLYECPYPYKRLITDAELNYCAKTGRFQFLKDTCCDSQKIAKRLRTISGTPLRLYNANTATLLDSLRRGAAGFSGVMANFHPALYVWLCRNWKAQPQKAELLQAALTICSQIEKQCYPNNAKVYLAGEGLPIDEYCRIRSSGQITGLFRQELEQLRLLTDWMYSLIKD